MFVIVGIAVVVGCVLGGFVMHDGPLLVLLQWNEFLIIGGAALGSLLVGTPSGTLKQIFGCTMKVLKGDPYTKEQYLNLLKTMFELFNVAKRDGLINLEPHIEKPHESAIFSKNPFLLNHHHALDYFCDTMRLLLGGGVPPHDLDSLLEADIDTHHEKASTISGIVRTVGDALPGLGIVAAVLGIIVTMGAINGPPEEVGLKVAAALVGTFLGVLLSYGFVGPLAGHLELLSQSEHRYFECIKAGIIAYAKGTAPVMVVEFARRVIDNDVRPAFTEVEQATKELKAH
ncbi:MAG: flagellar motor stator protein MotA [Ignavibacteria bacterium]|nr:flagellar motor stator protein MotA [Ignavibacteria bacterium]